MTYELELLGRNIIALGERDGIPGPAIAAVATASGATVVLSFTACFV